MVSKLLNNVLKNNFKKFQAEFQVEKITEKKAINFMLTGNAIKVCLIDG